MPPKRGFVAEDLWSLRAVSDPQLSPDGSRVAFVVGTPNKETDKQATRIWVAPADGSSPAKPFTVGPEDGAPRWSPDGKWLAFVAERGHGPQLHLAPLEGGEAVALTEMPYGASRPAWSPDGRQLAFVSKTGEWKKPDERDAIEKNAPRVVTGLYSRYDGTGWFDSRRSHLFVIGVDGGTGVDGGAGVKGGEPQQLTDGDWDDSDPAWSPSGDRIAFVSDRKPTRFDEANRDVWVVPVGARRRPKRLTRGRGTASSPRWSPDGAHIAYIGHENEDGESDRNIQLLVVATGEPTPPRSLSEPLDRPVYGLERALGTAHAWTGDGSAVMFLAADHGTLSLYRSALEGGSAPELVVGGDRQIIAMHTAGATIALASLWPSSPPEVYCTEIDGSRERRVSNANSEVRGLRLAPLRRSSHVAADGRRIESFVMYPTGYVKGQPVPLVIDIHGGPHSWHPQAALFGLYQTLAAAGYVVLLTNPRGSHSYGEEFAHACVGDWGGADFEDLMGAVDKLVNAGVADPEHLYATGYSYGGYMTSWAVGQTDRFAAACVAAPVTDLATIWGTTDIPNFVEHEVGALPWKRPELFAKHSPITHVANVTTPVMLLHWEGDMRCPIGQAEEFFQALRRLRREVVMVRYPGGFHIVRYPSQMVDYLERHLDWFAAH
jgi:dipeptidyl aminopeptidase/acylaminoacyl peptidase